MQLPTPNTREYEYQEASSAQVLQLHPIDTPEQNRPARKRTFSEADEVIQTSSPSSLNPRQLATASADPQTNSMAPSTSNALSATDTIAPPLRGNRNSKSVSPPIPSSESFFLCSFKEFPYQEVNVNDFSASIESVSIRNISTEIVLTFSRFHG